MSTFEQGYRLVDGDALNTAMAANLGPTGPTGPSGAAGATGPTGPAVAHSVSAAVSAAGTTRADATQLTSIVNVLGTVTSGTGVILVSAATVGIGNSVTLFNDGANPVQVYGAGSDAIDGVVAATGVVLTNAKRAVFYVTAAATYKSAQLGVVSA